jgi:DNA primase large subunit
MVSLDRLSEKITNLTFLADKFKSEYLYNIRHAYGDVGGDANRRGQGYTPYSCQKLLSEALPAAGQNHGCPYRTYNPDNLITLLQSVGVSDKDLLRTVREDVGKQRYHIACNRVFESAHKSELKKVCSDLRWVSAASAANDVGAQVKDESLWPSSQLDTILHPNDYFKRSFLLRNLDKIQNGDIGVVSPSSRPSQ